MAEILASCAYLILPMCSMITHYVDDRCLDSTAPSHRGADVMETLVAGKHAKTVNYARFRTPDRSRVVFFVIDINGAKHHPISTAQRSPANDTATQITLHHTQSSHTST